MTLSAEPMQEAIVHTAIANAHKERTESKAEEAIQSAIEAIRSNPNLANTQDQQGFTPLDQACRYGLDPIVKTLVDLKQVTPRDCTKSLYLAVANARKGSTILTTLLEANADPKAQLDCMYKKTPLHLDLEPSDELGFSEAVKTLVAANADPNAPTSAGLTPLHFAALGDHTNTVRHLINYNANPNVKSVNGNTPLHTAASRGHTHTAWLLIKQNADLNTKNEFGYTPLQKAANKKHAECQRMLLEATAAAAAQKPILKSNTPIGKPPADQLEELKKDLANASGKAVAEKHSEATATAAAAQKPIFRSNTPIGGSPADQSNELKEDVAKTLGTPETQKQGVTNKSPTPERTFRFYALTALTVSTAIISAICYRTLNCNEVVANSEESVRLAHEANSGLSGYFSSTVVPRATSWEECFWGE